MFIRTERLFLRPIWPEDWQDLFAGIGDEAVVRNLARVPWPYTAEDARNFAGMPQDRRCPHFLITRPRGAGGAEVIGVIGLAADAGKISLGYWIAKAHWGCGYATEAGRAVLSLARTLGHRSVMARHFLDNPASARVLSKLGFSPSGELGEAHCLCRGGMALAQEHALDLAAASNCDRHRRAGFHGAACTSAPGRHAA